MRLGDRLCVSCLKQAKLKPQNITREYTPKAEAEAEAERVKRPLTMTNPQDRADNPAYLKQCRGEARTITVSCYRLALGHSTL
jgi:hypothetical protein